jgi:tetratricopeptide (TPR) repeat protein
MAQTQGDNELAWKLAVSLSEKPEAPGKAWLIRGQVEIALSRKALAIRSFRKGVEKDPYYWRAKAVLGWALTTDGELEEGISWLSRAIADEPLAERPRCDRGLALLGLRRDSNAIEDLEACALSRDPSIALSATRGLAQAYLLAGRPDEGLLALRRLNPTHEDRDLRLLRRASAWTESDRNRELAKTPEDLLLSAIVTESREDFLGAAHAWQVVREPYSASPMNHANVRAAVCLAKAAQSVPENEKPRLLSESRELLFKMIAAYDSTVLGYRVLAHGILMEPALQPLFESDHPDSSAGSFAELSAELKRGLAARRLSRN